MRDRVDALEIGGRPLSDIPINRRDPAVFVSAEGAILIKLDIDAGHIMTGRLQPVDEDAADIAPMPRYQDPHLFTPTFSMEVCPGPIVPRATAFRAKYPCIARKSRGGRRRAACCQLAAPSTPAPNSSRLP